MKVALVNTLCPFVRGGAEYQVDTFAARLIARGHKVARIDIPFKWYPAQAIAEHILACRLFRVGVNQPDVVIAFKFPAYLCPYPKKKLWLLHQFRQAYELWGTPYAGIPDTPEGRGIRDLIVEADNKYLREAQSIYTNAKNTANRLLKYNGIKADGVLYPPLDRPELFSAGETGDYFFFPSRMSASKRQHLAIEAMKHVRSPVRLLLAGKPDSEAYGKELQKLVEQNNLGDKVQFLGYISEEEKARVMRESLGVLFVPFDEDFGMVTLEAFQSHKPMITCTDSGGTNEMVEHDQNGLSIAPTAEALAEAMDGLYTRRERARELGRAGYDSLAKHQIDWNHHIDVLLG